MHGFIRRVCDVGARIFGVEPSNLFITNTWKSGDISSAEEAIAYVLWAVGMDEKTIGEQLSINTAVRVKKAVKMRCESPDYSAKVDQLFMSAHLGARS